MLLATVVLSAAVTPQAPPQEATPPGFSAIQESAPMPVLGEPAPPTPIGIEASELPPGPTGAFQEHIDAGLAAFIRGRFSRARDAFEKAYEADPDSAAAAFYLGYACYKVGEPSARMNADKERARDLFAKAYRLDPAFEPVWGQQKTE